MNTANSNNGKVPKSQAEWQINNPNSSNSPTNFHHNKEVDRLDYENRLIVLFLNEYKNTGRIDYPVLKKKVKEAYDSEKSNDKKTSLFRSKG